MTAYECREHHTLYRSQQALWIHLRRAHGLNRRQFNRLLGELATAIADLDLEAAEAGTQHHLHVNLDGERDSRSAPAQGERESLSPLA